MARGHLIPNSSRMADEGRYLARTPGIRHRKGWITTNTMKIQQERRHPCFTHSI